MGVRNNGDRSFIVMDITSEMYLYPVIFEDDSTIMYTIFFRIRAKRSVHLWRVMDWLFIPFDGNMLIPKGTKGKRHEGR